MLEALALRKRANNNNLYSLYFNNKFPSNWVMVGSKKFQWLSKLSMFMETSGRNELPNRWSKRRESLGLNFFTTNFFRSTEAVNFE